MPYEVDVKYETKKSRDRFLKHSLLFSLILTIVIVADVLFITLSGEEFRPFMAVSIAITIIFSWYAIFFFTNIYTELNARYRYFKGYESGLKPVEEVVFLRKEKDLTNINGLYAYPLHVRYVSNLSYKDKIIYSFDEVNYNEGDKLTIETYQRILIKAEKHLWMS